MTVTFIAIKQTFDGAHLVEPGEEFEVDLSEGISPPPAEIAVRKDESQDN